MPRESAGLLMYRIRNGQVELGPRYSVTSQLEPVRARDPGEFTGGDAMLVRSLLGSTGPLAIDFACPLFVSRPASGENQVAFRWTLGISRGM